MKIKLLSIIAAGILVASTTVQADFFIQTSTQACPNITGAWNGTGKVYNWLIGDCYYRGTANVHSLDVAGNFVFDVVIDKTSGSIVCPNHRTESLRGVCQDGTLIFKTNFGHLTGSVADNGGNAQGTLTISPGITADVSISLKRT